MNNYHDLVDREEIANSVEFWNNTSYTGYKHAFIGKTVDEAITYWEAQAQKTDAVEKALKVYEKNSDLLASDEGFVIIRELLIHPERDRLRLIHDGSYYTHRIWFHICTDENHVTVSPHIDWVDSEFKRMSKHLDEKSPREKIDFLFKNFEVVYIQMPIPENREDVERWIREEMLKKKKCWTKKKTTER